MTYNRTKRIIENTKKKLLLWHVDIQLPMKSSSNFKLQWLLSGNGVNFACGCLLWRVWWSAVSKVCTHLLAAEKTRASPDAFRLRISLGVITGTDAGAAAGIFSQEELLSWELFAFTGVVRHFARLWAILLTKPRQSSEKKIKVKHS